MLKEWFNVRNFIQYISNEWIRRIQFTLLYNHLLSFTERKVIQL